jgi:kynurenine formamidase
MRCLIKATKKYLETLIKSKVAGLGKWTESFWEIKTSREYIAHRMVIDANWNGVLRTKMFPTYLPQGKKIATIPLKIYREAGGGCGRYWDDIGRRG